eukprot:TRINITY_DN45576_c0_g1_i1.p1 TRINITY_DN45576_c0_g1~~TRINITY_DN45576_c0_g1_i1.p1  ORF type:complete len:288 (+),score=80.55 TRINITY_DN45576_c0_g1_i1:76-939(+)
MWLAGLFSAIAIKLTSSVDDVLWLTPFLTSNISVKGRIRNVATYIGVCLIQTVLAVILACSGDEAVSWLTEGKKNLWSTEKILTVTSGSILVIYAIKLFHEYLYDDDGDEAGTTTGTEESSNEGASEELDKDKYVMGSPKKSGSEKKGFLEDHEEGYSRKESRSRQSHSRSSAPEPFDIDVEGAHLQVASRESSRSSEVGRQQTLFIIAFVGSIDDLTLFVPMLVGQGFGWAQLMIGAFLAAAIIVLLCMFVGLCKPIANCLSSIPLCLIVAAFAVTLLTKGLLMMD